MIAINIAGTSVLVPYDHNAFCLDTQQIWEYAQWAQRGLSAGCYQPNTELTNCGGRGYLDYIFTKCVIVMEGLIFIHITNFERFYKKSTNSNQNKFLYDLF